MLLETNDRGSSGKRTKHIKARYCIVKDTVDKQYMKIEWCVTDFIREDVLTKPKQGKSFRVLRSKLMNATIDYDDEKEQAKNGSDTTGVLKHKTEKKAET